MWNFFAVVDSYLEVPGLTPKILRESVPRVFWRGFRPCFSHGLSSIGNRVRLEAQNKTGNGRDGQINITVTEHELEEKQIWSKGWIWR